MRIILLDVFEVFRVDCVAPLSVHIKFLIIMTFPWIGVGVVQLLHCIANCRAGAFQAFMLCLKTLMMDYSRSRASMLGFQNMITSCMQQVEEELQLR
jgi:hypothetical protein